jgi:hypothetical protein
LGEINSSTEADLEHQIFLRGWQAGSFERSTYGLTVTFTCVSEQGVDASGEVRSATASTYEAVLRDFLAELESE